MQEKLEIFFPEFTHLYILIVLRDHRDPPQPWTLTNNPDKLLNQRSFTCSNAFGTIDQNHGYNRHIPFGFDSLVVIGQMLEQRFVSGIKNKLEKKYLFLLFGKKNI